MSVSGIFKTTSAYKLLTLFLASVPSNQPVFEDVSSRANGTVEKLFLPLL